MTIYRPPMRRIDKTAYGRQSHYYVDADDRRIPGVTTIIGDGVPKPALIKWGMNTTAAYAVDHWDDLHAMPVSERLKVLKGAAYAERDAAAKRGTEVHDLAEKLLHGQEVPVPDELAGHVESYVKYLDEWNPQVVIAEVPVVNYDLGFAGTIDLLFDLPDGRRVLADVKTTRSGIFGEVALQLAAYRAAQFYVDRDGAEKPMPHVDECWGIWVRADGYSVVPVEAGERELLFFRYAKKIAEWQNEISKTVVGEELHAPIAEGQEVLL